MYIYDFDIKNIFPKFISYICQTKSLPLWLYVMPVIYVLCTLSYVLFLLNDSSMMYAKMLPDTRFTNDI